MGWGWPVAAKKNYNDLKKLFCSANKNQRKSVFKAIVACFQ